MATEEYNIQQGEGKYIKFTVTRSGSAVDLTGKTLKFGMKARRSDTSYVHTVASNAFDRTNESSGEVRANIPASVTAGLTPGQYIGQLKVEMEADKDVDLSETITIQITPAVLHD